VAKAMEGNHFGTFQWNESGESHRPGYPDCRINESEDWAVWGFET